MHRADQVVVMLRCVVSESIYFPKQYIYWVVPNKKKIPEKKILGKYFLGLLIFSFRTNAKNKIKPGGKDASFRTKLREKKEKN